MQAYEDLVGGEGRRVFYRAERHKARVLFRRVVPEVQINNIPRRLHDLSMSGLSVRADRTAEWSGEVGAEVPVRLTLGEVVLHEGTGRICRVEPTPSGARIALHLTSGHLDIAALVAKHEELSLRHALDLANDVGLLDPDYRLICADVLHLLRRYRTTLEGFERQDTDGGARLDDAIEMCYERLLPEWRTLWHRANELVRPLMDDPARLKAAKDYTELLLTPEFLAGPIWRRSYEKPLGYPGDYQVMNYAYAVRRQGDGAYARLMHGIGVDLVECVATRMVMMQQIIAETATRDDIDAPVRISTIGCGPAQEVANFLNLKTLPRPLHFTLIDQDHGALTYAYEQTYPRAVRPGNMAVIDCLHVSFSQLLKVGKLLLRLQPQDLIYSIGLVDYLAPRSARALVAALFERLAPGGRLVIGNVRDVPENNLWPGEFICDWSLIYRNEAEMLALADGLGGASVDLKVERTGKVFMLSITKGA